MKDLCKLMNTKNINKSEDVRLNEMLLEKEIEHLQKKRCKTSSQKAQAQWAIQREIISNYWSRVNDQKTPRDIIHKLNIPNTNRYTTKLEKMVEIAKTCHEEIQKADLPACKENAQCEARFATLAEIPDEQKLDSLAGQI
jgi:hypothetical protein